VQGLKWDHVTPRRRLSTPWFAWSGSAAPDCLPSVTELFRSPLLVCGTNSLPDLVTSAPSVAVFRSRLKTQMLNISYPSPLWLYSACAVTFSCFGHYNRSCLLTYLLTYFFYTSFWGEFWGGWALTESSTLSYQPHHLTSFICSVIALLLLCVWC